MIFVDNTVMKYLLALIVLCVSGCVSTYGYSTYHPASPDVVIYRTEYNHHPGHRVLPPPHPVPHPTPAPRPSPRPIPTPPHRK